MLLLLVAVGLQSCGGGGGSGGDGGGDRGGGAGSATSGTKVDVSGTITGLSGSLVLLLNGIDVNFTTVGTFVLLPQISTGASYSVTVATQPAGQHCTVTNGSGTAGATAPAKVLIDCVNANLALAASATTLISYRYDATTGQLTQSSIVGGGIGISAVGFDPAANFAYAVDGAAGQVTLYSVDTLGTLSSASSAVMPSSATHLDAFVIAPDGQLAYMLYWDAGAGVERVQAYAISSSGVLAVSGGPVALAGQLQVTAAAFASSGTHALVLDAGGLTQYEIGSAGWSGTPTSNFPLGSTHGMAVDPVADLTLVSATDTSSPPVDNLWGLSTTVTPGSTSVLLSIPSTGPVNAPGAVAFDPTGQRVLLASGSALAFGTSSSQGSSLQPVQLSSTTLPTAGAPSGLAFSTDSQYSYVAVSGAAQLTVLKWSGGTPSDVSAGLSPIAVPGGQPVTALAFR
jgi:sugar lactone lactonase YvrE